MPLLHHTQITTLTSSGHGRDFAIILSETNLKKVKIYFNRDCYYAKYPGDRVQVREVGGTKKSG